CHGNLAGVDLRTATIADIQAALQAGEFTSVDLVNAYIERIQKLDNHGDLATQLNGVRAINPHALEYAAAMDAERAAGKVRGPMHGIPLMMKDNINTFDMPTTGGSIALESNMAPKDAGLVTRLRDNGAVILGKLELLEWANWGAPSNGSSIGGPQHNGYNGGSASASSSGPGVAGSMAYGSVALGSETSGSILGPTQTNGIAGLKTSHGLVSGAGVIPIGHYFDVVGPMGRSVYDLAVTLSAMAGTDPDDPLSVHADSQLPPNSDYTQFLRTDALEGVRLGYDPTQTGELFTQAKEVLQAQGAILVPMESGTQYGAVGLATEIPVLPNEFHFEINEYLQKEADPSLPFKTWHQLMLYNNQNNPDAHGPAGASGFALASAATPGNGELVHLHAPAAIAVSRNVADRIFSENQIAAVVAQGSPNTGLGAAAGYPTVMIPLGYNGDNAVGISWFGKQFTDGNLLGYAYAYEQATGNKNRIPPELFNAKLLEGLCEDVDVTMASKPMSRTEYDPVVAEQTHIEGLEGLRHLI
ncbi:MAG TPA: amidase family protein, partial [Candidatus Thermoplasmatota archaeon]